MNESSGLYDGIQKELVTYLGSDKYFCSEKSVCGVESSVKRARNW